MNPTRCRFVHFAVIVAALARAAGSDSGRPAFDARVMSALNHVPRQRFVPGSEVPNAYENRPRSALDFSVGMLSAAALAYQLLLMRGIVTGIRLSPNAHFPYV